MFVQHADARILLRECPDRRSGERMVHRDPVHVDGHAAVGCDISSKGLCVIMTPMTPRVTVGEIVRVTLAGQPGRVAEVTSPARVARVDRRADRFVVGLQFVD